MNFPVLIFLACAAAGAVAQPPAAEPGADTASAPAQLVEIKGVRDPEFKPYAQMLLGVAAFKKFHAYAPATELKFILRPRKPIAFDAITLRLDGATTSLPVEIDQEGVFRLPVVQQAIDEGAELVLNQTKGSVRMRPFIRTPGLGPHQLRLGDLRLECEIIWAIEQQEASFLARNTFKLLGGPCASSKIQSTWSYAQPLKTATLVSGDRRLALPVLYHGYSYAVPIHDKSWDDASTVQFEILSR